MENYKRDIKIEKINETIRKQVKNIIYEKGKRKNQKFICPFMGCNIKRKSLIEIFSHLERNHGFKIKELNK